MRGRYDPTVRVADMFGPSPSAVIFAPTDVLFIVLGVTLIYVLFRIYGVGNSSERHAVTRAQAERARQRERLLYS